MSKRKINEQIAKEIKKLHDAERNTEKEHVSSSLPQTIDDNADSREAVTHLDALARLITGPQDVCTAVSFDGDKLLLSSNKSINYEREASNRRGGGLVSAKKFMEAFKKFANDPSQANYKVLEGFAEAKSMEARSEIVEQKAKLKSAEMSARQSQSSTAFLTELREKGNIKSLYSAAEAVINDDRAPLGIKNLASDILQPIVDTKRIANAIISRTLDENTIGAIINNKLEYINGDDDIHAEMKIMEYLDKNGKLQKGKTFNIGVTKLACCPCYLARQRVVDLKGAKINIAGTHGGTYETWVIPDFLSGDAGLLKLLQEETTRKYEKRRESTDVTRDDLGIMQAPCWLDGQGMTQYKEGLPTKPLEQTSDSKSLQSSGNQKGDKPLRAEDLPYTDAQIIDIFTRTPNVKIITGQQQQTLVSNAQQLEKALERVKDGDDSNYVIPMRINMDTNNFGAEGVNNHFVGVHVLKEKGKVTKINYVDPTGELGDEEILKMIAAGLSDKKAKDKALTVESYTIQLLHNNHEDSGPLMVYMLQQVARWEVGIEELQTKESISNWLESRALAKQLRQEQRQGEHLKRAGKEAGEAYDIRESFAASNTNNLDLLEKVRKEAVITADIDLKAVDVKEQVASDKVGKVEFLAEGNHIQDHAQNTESLINRIVSGDIGKNTVIAIERKSYGNNLGVPDVIMLASILEHNEKNPAKQLKVPKEITKDSLIYQDAALYNTAKKHGVKVVGLEGRNLRAGKELPEEYNQAREDYMAGRITQLTSKGYNVIAYVGSAHVENLERAVERKLENKPSVENAPNQVSEELQKMAASIGQQARAHVTPSSPTTSSIPVIPNENQPNKRNSGVGGR